MRKAIRLMLALALAYVLMVPAFGYSTTVVYDAAVEAPHVVSFDPCNGGEVIQIVLYEDGYVEVLPTPQSTSARSSSTTNSGYKFNGWHLDNITPFTTATFVDRDMTVYARWQELPDTDKDNDNNSNNNNNNNSSNNNNNSSNNNSNNTNKKPNSGSTGGVTSPKTFDPGIAHYWVMAAMSATTSTAMVLGQKRKKYVEVEIDVNF